MQRSLFVLVLMGQCSFFVCHLYEYHFIEVNKTWKEAQSYCRENYTDLATVSNMTDMERLRNSSRKEDAWIGLHNTTNANRTWYWSLPGVEYNDTEAQWCKDPCEPDQPNQPNQPNQPDNKNSEFCVTIRNGKWHDDLCTKLYAFICYNERGLVKRIDENKSWLQAQSYCREHHTDLISGLKQINEFNQSKSIFWIGLFKDSWSWSDGRNFSFRYWDPQSFVENDNKKCAVTQPNGTWSADSCTNKKPFYCYDDKVILIKESMTWDEALTYCRKNHRDLVSITNGHQQRWVQKRAMMADTDLVWMGMRYSCVLDLWFWVSDHLVCYDNWAPEGKTEECVMAAAMHKDGKWFEKTDTEKFNFICSVK